MDWKGLQTIPLSVKPMASLVVDQFTSAPHGAALLSAPFRFELLDVDCLPWGQNPTRRLDTRYSN